MVPAALAAAMAMYLRADRVFLLLEGDPKDSDLAFLEEVSRGNQFGAQLLAASDAGWLVMHGDLVVDLGTTFQDLEDERFFKSNVHWLTGGSTEGPKKLRFDSSFYSASNEYMNDTWTISEKFASPANINGVEDRAVESKFVGTWTENKGVDIKKNIWRRRNLQGITLKVTTVPSTRFMFENKGKFTGLIADIVTKMADMSNFTVEWVIPPDGAYGSQISDGSWNGMIGLLQEKQVDMSAALLSLSLSRNEVISYLSPYLESKSTFLVHDKTLKATSGSINVSGYISVFDDSAWVCFFCTLFLELLVFVFFIKRASPASSTSGSIKTSLFLTMNTFLKLSVSDELPLRKVSHRTLLWVCSLFPIVVMAYYEGVLTSYMTIPDHATELKSISDILTTGHKIVLVNNSIQLSEFVNAPPGSGREKVYKKLIKDNPSALVKTSFEMDELALKDSNIVIVGSALKGYIAPNGLYGLTGLDDAIPDPLAFAVQKDSEYFDIMNYNMIQLYQFGVLEYIKDKWIGKQKPAETCGKEVESDSARYDRKGFYTTKVTSNTLL